MKFRLVWVGSDDDGGGVPRLRESPATLSDHTPRSGYEQRDGALFRRERLQNGRSRFTQLTNFTARIVSDIVLDDGEQERREFSVEAEVGGCKMAFPLSTAEFGSMNWVLRRLGPKAIVCPGQQQHARAAIQWLSGPVQQERTFTHLGWRKWGTQYMYLHADGALGADGILSGVQVQLPSSLQLFRIPPPERSSDQAQFIRASLRFLSLAPDRVTFPLLAAVYRAPFGKVDFSMFLVGKTGVFKTAIAAICQQHFGSAMNAAHLPGHFASTANALELLAFHAKDALLVVDDFAPAGRHGDEGLESIAERLFRAVGNQQGRSRMVGNGQVQQSRSPRALLLATREEVPQGHSIRARLLIVEAALGEVDGALLSECQRAGEEVIWLARWAHFSLGSPAVTRNCSSVSKRGHAKSAVKGEDAQFMPVSQGLLRSYRVDLDCGWSLRLKPGPSARQSERNWNRDVSGLSRNWPCSRLATTRPAIPRGVFSAC